MSEQAIPAIPTAWEPILTAETEKPYFHKLAQFLAEERHTHTVFPPASEVFSALALTPYERVRVLLLGQDPYPNDNQAHGLAFSVRPGVPTPRSLVNIFEELHDDLGCRIPNNGYLVHWAEQGILLLNAVLTVQAQMPNSHKNKGWEQFTDQIIQAVSAKEKRVVFVLWGGYARKKLNLIDAERHVVVQSAHPSPLSVHKGFFGSRPFSRINSALRDAGQPEIDWQIPDL